MLGNSVEKGVPRVHYSLRDMIVFNSELFRKKLYTVVQNGSEILICIERRRKGGKYCPVAGWCVQNVRQWLWLVLGNHWCADGTDETPGTESGVVCIVMWKEGAGADFCLWKLPLAFFMNWVLFYLQRSDEFLVSGFAGIYVYLWYGVPPSIM